MRFNKRNWNKFFDDSNKTTTIRLRKSKIGHHKAYAGSYYHPEILGEFDIAECEPKRFCDLNIYDAIQDGFKTINELKEELKKINGNILPHQIVYVNHIKNAKRN